jgi:hypothetical protein
MRLSKNVVLIAAIAIFSAFLSGCVLIPIAGFGYTGYQYHEKEGVFAPGQPLGGPGPASADKDKKPAGSNSQTPAASDANIE